ncbi:MAG: protein translocase subunit SecF [Aphanocapsa feldmannii 288cV]|nr:MAG: protein translocase subunit SecF [Aphanocapsa feldmannii 288cV]
MTFTTPRPGPGSRSPGLRISRHGSTLISISLALLLAAVLGFVMSTRSSQIGSPLNAGLDFTGGTSLQLELRCAASGCDSDQRFGVAAVRQFLADLPLPPVDSHPVDLANASIQVLDGGAGLVVRSAALHPSQTKLLVEKLDARFGPIDQAGIQLDSIGPLLGAELLRSSVVALLVAFAAVAAYIAIRFSPIYASLALAALVHDVLIVCGLFAWLGLLLGVEVDSLFAVALLTLAGYSVNDSVVVFDRIRETGRLEPGLSLREQVDRSVTASLSRSINTSATTELPIIALAIFSSGGLQWFGVALAFGIAVGTYSSLCFAPPLLLLLLKRGRLGRQAEA